MIVRELVTLLGFDVDASEIRRYEQLVTQTGQRMRSLGQSLLLPLTVPLMASGAAVLKWSGDFEYAMNRVQVLTQATSSEFEALEQQAKDLGISTQFSATQAAEGMGFLAQAGFSAEEIIAAMPATLNLAAASQQDLATTADQLSNMMQQYQIPAIDAERVTDVLAKTAARSNTSVTQLAQAMSFAGGAAHQVGLSIEETASLMGIMGNAGVQSTRAGRGLRMAMLTLLDPSSDAQRVLERLNVTVSDGAGGIRNFVSILEELEAAGATIADLEALFGTEAITGILAITSAGSESVQRFADVIRDSAGTAAEQAETQMRGFMGSLKELRSAVEGLAIAIGESGVLEWFTGLAKNLAGAIREMAKANPELLRFSFILGAIIASIPPLLIGIGLLTSAMATLSAASGPVAIIATLIAVALAGAIALGFAIEDAYVWMKGGKSVFGEWLGPFDQFRKTSLSWIDDVKEGVKDTTKWFELLWEDQEAAGNKFGQFMRQLFGGIFDVARIVLGFIAEEFGLLFTNPVQWAAMMGARYPVVGESVSRALKALDEFAVGTLAGVAGFEDKEAFGRAMVAMTPSGSMERLTRNTLSVSVQVDLQNGIIDSSSASRVSDSLKSVIRDEFSREAKNIISTMGGIE